MIIRQDGTFETCSLYPNINWYEGQQNYVIDETTIEGQEMMDLYINEYPLVNLTFNEYMFVTGVSKVELQRPEEIAGKEIVLQKNDLNLWEYIYVDVPLTKEQELEKEVISLRAMIENLVGGGI